MANQVDFPDIYIDGSTGGVGSEVDPYSDISEINWTTGGDNSVFDYYDGSPAASVTINLKAGETWREKIASPTSGTATYPIIVQSYDVGDDAIISAADLEDSFTEDDIVGLTGDANMRTYVMMEEESGNRADGTGGDDWVDNATVTSAAVDPPEGSRNAFFDSDNSEYLSRGTQPANYPGGYLGATPDDFTIGMWFRLTSLYDWQTLYMLSEPYNLHTNGSNYLEFVTSADSGKTVTSNSALSTATWYHVVIRWKGTDNDELSMWIDGVKQNDTETPSSWSATENQAFIGASNGGGQFLDGEIDEFFAMDRYLSDAEIADLYANGLAGAGSTPRWYYSAAAEPTQVFIDDVRLAKEETEANIGTGEWWWDAGNDRVYIADDPGAAVVETSIRTICIETVHGVSYITYRNLTLEKSAFSNSGRDKDVASESALERNYIIFDNVNSYRPWGSGHDHDKRSTGLDTGWQYINSEIAYCGNMGLRSHSLNASAGTIDTLYANNELHHCCQFDAIDSGEPLIHVFGAAIQIDSNSCLDVIIENNYIHDMDTGNDYTGHGAGIHLDSWAYGVIIRNNLIIDIYGEKAIFMEMGICSTECYGNVCINTTSTAIHLGSSIEGSLNHDNLVYNNSVFNTSAGLKGPAFRADSDDVEGCATGNIVKNNIFIGDDATGERTFEIYDGMANAGGYGSGNVYINNCIMNATGGDNDQINWDEDPYATVALWEAGVDDVAVATDNIGTDPKYTDPASDDLTLQSDSPCIGAGEDLGDTYKLALHPDSSWPGSVSKLDMDTYGWVMGAFGYEGAIDLTVADLAHVLALEAPVVPAIFGLTVADLAHASSLEAPVITVVDGGRPQIINIGFRGSIRMAISKRCVRVEDEA